MTLDKLPKRILCYHMDQTEFKAVHGLDGERASSFEVYYSFLSNLDECNNATDFNFDSKLLGTKFVLSTFEVLYLH